MGTGTGTGMAVAGLLVVLVAPSAPGIVRAANPPATSGGDVFASGPKPGGSGGDAYDASACQDPQIAVLEQRRNVRAYRDTDGRVGIAAHALARELGDPSIDRGGVCLHASGIVYLIPRAQDERFAAMLQELRSGGEGGGAGGGNDSAGGGSKNLRVHRTPVGTTDPGTHWISRSGCPFPPDIDPARQDPGIPLEARINGAEAAMDQRQRLCRQGQGYLVPGGCALHCVAEPTTPRAGDPPRPAEAPRPARTSRPPRTDDLLTAMDRCLREKSGFAFYRTPRISYVKGTPTPATPFGADRIALDAAQLDAIAARDPLRASFLVSKRLADAVVAQFLAQAGADPAFARERVRRRDIVMGFLHGCAVTERWVPDYDRQTPAQVAALFDEIDPATQPAGLRHWQDFRWGLTFRDVGFARDAEWPSAFPKATPGR
ncbi:MAG: hypothetical protein U1F11_05465 [Steroidobacteraceae bacterium]